MIPKVKRQWIYTPKSESRIFTCRPGQEFIINTYCNGSHDLFYQGVLMKWSSAFSENYFRNELKKYLESFVQSTTGVAWDDRGTIYAAVPLSCQYLLYEQSKALLELLKKTWEEQQAIEALMMAEGIASMILKKHGEFEMERKWNLERVKGLTFDHETHKIFESLEDPPRRELEVFEDSEKVWYTVTKISQVPVSKDDSEVGLGFSHIAKTKLDLLRTQGTKEAKENLCAMEYASLNLPNLTERD
jgi:hypothetical protein